MFVLKSCIQIKYRVLYYYYANIVSVAFSDRSSCWPLFANRQPETEAYSVTVDRQCSKLCVVFAKICMYIVQGVAYIWCPPPQQKPSELESKSFLQLFIHFILGLYALVSIWLTYYFKVKQGVQKRSKMPKSSKSQKLFRPFSRH